MGECCDRQPGSWRLPPEKLWIDHLCLQSAFVFFFFFFPGLVIFKDIDFNVFSLDGGFTAEESALRRNGIPWSFTSACLDWKLWLSVVPRESFVDEKRSLDPSHASAERMSRLFGELSSSPWTGAVLSETIQTPHTTLTDVAQHHGEEQTSKLTNEWRSPETCELMDN